jgi:lipoprotein signal peptidase
MLILTPAARAEIHSAIGTKVKKIPKKIKPNITSPIINIADASIVFLLMCNVSKSNIPSSQITKKTTVKNA